MRASTTRTMHPNCSQHASIKNQSKIGFGGVDAGLARIDTPYPYDFADR